MRLPWTLLTAGLLVAVCTAQSFLDTVLHQLPFGCMKPALSTSFTKLASLFKHEEDVHDNIADSGIYAPLRPPAVPLAVRGPYTNAWMDASHDGRLATNGAMYWQGAPLGWTGLVAVDGTVYQWMGRRPTDDLNHAETLAVRFDSQYSNFTFQCGEVVLTARFFSPVTPHDLCRASIPLSYLQVEVVSADNEAHHVQVYSDVDGAWVTTREHDPVHGKLRDGGGGGLLKSWLVEPSNPVVFGEDDDKPSFGNLTFTSHPGHAHNFTFQAGDAAQVQAQFETRQTLTNTGHAEGRPVFAYTHDLGVVGGADAEAAASVLYTIGVMQEPAIAFLGKDGISHLNPWWKRCYGGMGDVIEFHYNDYEYAVREAAKFEAQLQDDVSEYFGTTTDYGNATGTRVDTTAPVNQFGEKYIFDGANAMGFLDQDTKANVAVPGINEADAYYAIVALSTRQLFASYTLTERPAYAPDNDKPYNFQKETSSNGNMNTVDVMYPAWPFFAYTNIDLLRYSMDPIWEMTETGFYPNKYSLHDIGSHYPNATGHLDGLDEGMPVEECGNQIISTLAVHKFGHDREYLLRHYHTLQQYAEYLEESALYPSTQVSTDDFFAALANQTNLAIKGIVGLRAMSVIATELDHREDAVYYADMASRYLHEWRKLAVDPTHTHTLLAYSWRGSWGQLYNTYPAFVLDIDFDNLVGQMQHLSMSLLQHGQKFGLPLDSRQFYTKSDWQMWTAAYNAPRVRRYLVTSLAYWLDTTQTGRPFADLYDTGTGEFPADPDMANVVGGHFAFLANLKTGKKHNSVPDL